MCKSINMDVSSVRSLVSLVVQLQTIIIFAQALSVSNKGVTSRPKTRGGESSQNQNQNPKSCCFNGGQCYLGSFCLCPTGYHGRYCEYAVEKSKCGNLPHGSWVKAGCNLCQCNFGRMTCLPRVFDGCDDKPPDENVDPWDYRDEMVVLATDDTSTNKYDAMDVEYADYYDTAGDHSGSSGSLHGAGSAAATRCAVVVACLVTVVTLVTMATSSSPASSWRRWWWWWCPWTLSAS